MAETQHNRVFAEDSALFEPDPLEFLASASLGVVASMMTFVVIKLTNSVTLKVLNTARNAAFVLFSVTFLQEPTTALQLSGYVVSLASFGAYTWYKSQGR